MAPRRADIGHQLGRIIRRNKKPAARAAEALGGGIHYQGGNLRGWSKTSQLRNTWAPGMRSSTAQYYVKGASREQAASAVSVGVVNGVF